MAESKNVKADFSGWRFPADPDYFFAYEEKGIESRGTFVGIVFERDVNFQGATFGSAASFERATSRGLARFEGTRFERIALFRGATFDTYVSFDDATFVAHARFDHAKFGADAWFKVARFGGDTRFHCAKCSPGATAVFALPSRRRTLTGPTSERSAGRAASILGQTVARWLSFLMGGPQPFCPRRDGETAYRFAKQSAQGAGDYAQAGRYHYAEQCAIEDRQMHESGLRPWRGAFWPWLLRLLLGRIVFGYGERPLRPLFVGLAVIIACAALYFAVGGVGRGADVATVEAYRPSFRESLHFSVVTFTTLGYGDFEPKARWRWLADLEAVFGAALLATFVVCLTRKYMR